MYCCFQQCYKDSSKCVLLCNLTKVVRICGWVFSFSEKWRLFRQLPEYQLQCIQAKGDYCKPQLLSHIMQATGIHCGSSCMEHVMCGWHCGRTSKNQAWLKQQRIWNITKYIASACSFFVGCICLGLSSSYSITDSLKNLYNFFFCKYLIIQSEIFAKN